MKDGYKITTIVMIASAALALVISAVLMIMEKGTTDTTSRDTNNYLVLGFSLASIILTIITFMLRWMKGGLKGYPYFWYETVLGYIIPVILTIVALVMLSQSLGNTDNEKRDKLNTTVTVFLGVSVLFTLSRFTGIFSWGKKVVLPSKNIPPLSIPAKQLANRKTDAANAASVASTALAKEAKNKPPVATKSPVATKPPVAPKPTVATTAFGKKRKRRKSKRKSVFWPLF